MDYAKWLFATKLARMAQVPVEDITWKYLRVLKSGAYSGKCVIDSPGCKVTAFKFSKNGRKFRFAKIGG